MNLASDLTDVLPPHPKRTGSTDLIRLLVTIVRRMPLRSNLRCLESQRVAWAHHHPSTKMAAMPSAILAASAVPHSHSPYVGMGASRRGVLAIIAQPHCLDLAATRHLIKIYVIVLCGVQLSDQLWKLISQKAPPRSFLLLLCCSTSWTAPANGPILNHGKPRAMPGTQPGHLLGGARTDLLGVKLCIAQEVPLRHQVGPQGCQRAALAHLPP